MATSPDLSKLVPGFDFLQGLAKNAGGGLPGLTQWLTPSLDPQELDKRIGELRTVQFWLEQNAKLLGSTIQALEVQRLTLSTLQTMNLPLASLGEALKIRPTAAAAPAAPPAAPAEAAPAATASSRAARKPAAAPAAAPGVVDPMQWWGALTQQFTELAAQSVRETPAPTGKTAGTATAPRKRAAKRR